MKIAIEPAGPVDFDVTVPGSKSLTNRALVAAALARGRSRLANASFSDDSGFLSSALNEVGVRVESDEKAGVVNVAGGAIGTATKPLFMGNAGTALRFFTSLACLGSGRYVIDGDERMRERPIGGLVDGLRGLGAKIGYGIKGGYPPLAIDSEGLRGGRTSVKGDTSSQFVSSLLLSAPGATDSVEIEVAGEAASKPYVDLTLEVMKAFGVKVERDGYRRFRIPRGSRYTACSYSTEADGASAGYFLAMAAATGGRARVGGIGSSSVQGEIRFAAILEKM